jgi:hypothetical protein
MVGLFERLNAGGPSPTEKTTRQPHRDSPPIELPLDCS